MFPGEFHIIHFDVEYGGNINTAWGKSGRSDRTFSLGIIISYFRIDEYTICILADFKRKHRIIMFGYFIKFYIVFFY